MKIISTLTLAVAIILSISCKKNETSTNDQTCATKNGRQLYLGPKGGCYYLTSGGNKEYVDRSECVDCK